LEICLWGWAGNLELEFNFWEDNLYPSSSSDYGYRAVNVYCWSLCSELCKEVFTPGEGKLYVATESWLEDSFGIDCFRIKLFLGDIWEKYVEESDGYGLDNGTDFNAFKGCWGEQAPIKLLLSRSYESSGLEKIIVEAFLKRLGKVGAF